MTQVELRQLKCSSLPFRFLCKPLCELLDWKVLLLMMIYSIPCHLCSLRKSKLPMRHKKLLCMHLDSRVSDILNLSMSARLADKLCLLGLHRATVRIILCCLSWVGYTFFSPPLPPCNFCRFCRIISMTKYASVAEVNTSKWAKRLWMLMIRPPV